MSNMIRHPFHLVDESPWPLIGSMGAFFLTSGLVKWFHYSSSSLLCIGLMVISLTTLQWWSDISSEGTNQGLHPNVVELGLRWGMLLFIISEVFFFMSFFWAFFHSSLAPSPEVGGTWPPTGIQAFSPFQIPLLNTLILLSSGVSVTWSHHALMKGNQPSASIGLMFTVFLGVYFTLLQAMEYLEAPFSLADGSYGSTFFIATGFHGLHVMVGTLFLAICLFRLESFHFSATHHFGFEAAAWYWHFVDVIWLFLYIWLYCWGSL